MDYNHHDIEQSAQRIWHDADIYRVEIDCDKPSYYVLDMFPYPSGAGLHVGHPLGYIASDIYARYKRLQGYNVLHPMGYDAFGLPAEQYAIQTNRHPEETTQVNIARYREQLDNIGFGFDWSRQVVTCDPEYYKWTQWAFIQLFHHYYDTATERAEPIDKLIQDLEAHGTEGCTAYASTPLELTAEAWRDASEAERSEWLMHYRLAFLGESVVNWCPELGTVLANDEVSDGVSERGGYPVVQRKMKQWSLRVSAYAERLLAGLDQLDWSDALKEMQRNWIGKSVGASVTFKASTARGELPIEVFTTRPDTLYGVTFMVLAPESSLVADLTTEEQRDAVETYLDRTKRRTERERQADHSVTGVFTGSYAQHPLTEALIPIWISDYVLAGYGTGAIMAVPAHDSRDFAFARHFDLPIRQVVLPKGGEESDPSTWSESIDSKEGELINSPLLNGKLVSEAIDWMCHYLDEQGLGQKRINYRLRDAIFSRQRYWGEPIPIYYKEGVPHTLPLDKLPLTLPEVDKYLPTESGEPPLGRAKHWCTEEGYPYELCTMPGFAGSSAYYLRYMDPHNHDALVSPDANNYWRQVDLYIGGTEHATGHLIYSRFWNKFLYDLGIVCEDEPFKRLVNQGMIQGRSNYVYRIKGTNQFVTYSQREQYDVTQMHVDIHLVHNDVLDQEAFRQWRDDLHDATFITEADGSYLCGYGVEKMSKSMFNVVNPDEIIEQYGADTLRMYEMFLGPLEQSKPWDTNGIDGVYRFLKRVWSLYHNSEGQLPVSTDAQASREELRTIHKLIQKITQDIERLSFNTSVSAFMIAVGELQKAGTTSLEVLRPLAVLLSPFAPHIAEMLWQEMRTACCSDTLSAESIVMAAWPQCDESLIAEDSVRYPVSFNGKVRFNLELPAGLSKEQIEEQVLAHPDTVKWIDGKPLKKVIVVPGRIVNIVL